MLCFVLRWVGGNMFTNDSEKEGLQMTKHNQNRTKIIGDYKDDFYWERVNHSLGWLGDNEQEQRERQSLLKGMTVGVSVSNLLVVDEDLHVLEGEGMPNPANRFHAWIYRARPDVTCVIHTHPLYTSALSMLEIPMQIAHMDACVLYDNIAFLSDWPGVPVGNSEGEIISAALGEKRSLLLAHHGLIVVGKNVEEACVLAVQFERAAKLYMLASSVGKICDIDAKLGKEARDWILQDPRTSSIFAYFARQTISADPACLSACEHSL